MLEPLFLLKDYDYSDRFVISLEDLPTADKDEVRKLTSNQRQLWEFLDHQNLVELYGLDEDEKPKSLTYVIDDKHYHYELAHSSNELFIEGKYYPALINVSSKDDKVATSVVIIPIIDEDEKMDTEKVNKLALEYNNVMTTTFPHIFTTEAPKVEEE